MRRNWVSAVKYTVLGILSVGSLFPFVWMVITSLKPSAEVYASPPIWIPSRLTLEHYTRILHSDFPKTVLNSTILALVVTFLILLIASFAAYGFTRFRFPGNRGLLLSTLFGHFLPDAVRFFPLFVFFAGLGLANTHGSLILTSSPSCSRSPSG